MSMSYRQSAQLNHPGATCKKEGNLYVVRNVDGWILAARANCSNAWAAANRAARIRPLFADGRQPEA